MLSETYDTDHLTDEEYEQYWDQVIEDTSTRPTKEHIRVAAHEAAHAVVCTALGVKWRVADVLCRPDSEGRILHHPTKNPRIAAMISAAGPVADWMLSGEGPEWFNLGDTDGIFEDGSCFQSKAYEAWIKSAAVCDFVEYQNYLLDETEEILRNNHEHWINLAQRLALDVRVEAKDVRSVVIGDKPKPRRRTRVQSEPFN